jgi:hypothetical protein
VSGMYVCVITPLCSKGRGIPEYSRYFHSLLNTIKETTVGKLLAAIFNFSGVKFLVIISRLVHHPQEEQVIFF